MAQLVSLPGRLDWTVWHGQEEQAILNWPADSLAGTGPWTASITVSGEDPIAVTVDVAGDVMTLTLPAGATTGLTHQIGALTVTDDDRDRIAGTVRITDQPGPSTTEATVTIDEQTVTVELVGDPALSAELDTLQTALDAHEADEVVHRIVPVLWDTAAGWGRFSRVDVTNMDVTTDTLDVTAEGAATIEATGPSGSDRRIYQLDGFTGADMQARVEYAADAGAQIGLALRVNPAVSLIAWQNIFFGASASILRGVWEWEPPGDTGTLSTNQTGDTPAQEKAIVSAEGDGSTVTVRSELPHLLTRTGGNVKLFFGPFDGSTTFSATPVDATTFTVPSAEVGSWSSGTWSQGGVILAGPIRRHIKAAIKGGLFSIAHWFDGEPEPGLLDPLRSSTLPLPDPLSSSGGPPPASGGVGIVVGHLGDTPKTLTIYDFDARAL